VKNQLAYVSHTGINQSKKKNIVFGKRNTIKEALILG